MTARPEDWPGLLRLWQRCFGDSAESWDFFRTHLWRPEETLVLREGGDIVSCLALLPCAFSGGLTARYIYAVATDPDKRGRGLAARLMAGAEERARASGADLAVLLTEEDSLQSFYARLGYGPCCTAARRAPAGEDRPGGARAMTAEDLPAAAALYDGAAAGRTAVLRDQDYWRLRLLEYGGGAAVWADGPRVTAYGFFDERGVTEAAGPAADALVRARAPRAARYPTIPRAGERTEPLGCAKALTARGARALENGELYLNLMFN